MSGIGAVVAALGCGPISLDGAPDKPDWRSVIRLEGLGAMSGDAFGSPDLQLLRESDLSGTGAVA